MRFTDLKYQRYPLVGVATSSWRGGAVVAGIYLREEGLYGVRLAFDGDVTVDEGTVTATEDGRGGWTLVVTPAEGASTARVTLRVPCTSEVGAPATLEVQLRIDLSGDRSDGSVAPVEVS